MLAWNGGNSCALLLVAVCLQGFISIARPSRIMQNFQIGFVLIAILSRYQCSEVAVHAAVVVRQQHPWSPAARAV